MNNNEVFSDNDPRIRGAVAELQELIRAHYPEAVFEVSRGEDPDGVYLDAFVDAEDPDQVMDLVIDRLFQLRVEQGLPVHVLPQPPIERSLEAVRAQRAKWSWAQGRRQNSDPASLGL